MTIYLDNAATSHPKPPGVYEAVHHALVDIAASPGRAAHRLAREAAVIVSRARHQVAALFGIDDPRQVIFTASATESINVVLKGWLRPGDRVVVSAMEHNAVVRPLMTLSRRGVSVHKVRCSAAGHLDLDDLEHSLEPPPRLVALVHASNVNGALQPAEAVAELCARRGVPLLLDAAQTAGVQPIAAAAWGLGMLACSGHKGLFGPQGVGVLYLRPDLDVVPLLEGGTGSRSEEEELPTFRPDRYECGTHNLPGIAGLGAGAEFLLAQGVAAIARHELELAARIEEGLLEVPGVTVHRPQTRGTGAVSFNIADMNPGDVGGLLDTGFDIAVRTGLHCAPWAHQTLGTFAEGSVRVAPGFYTTSAEVEEFLAALRTLSTWRRR